MSVDLLETYTRKVQTLYIKNTQNVTKTFAYDKQNKRIKIYTAEQKPNK